MKPDTILAAWDWHIPRRTERDRAYLVDLVADIGFDTLVVGKPTDDLVAKAHDKGLRVAAVVSAGADKTFAEAHPELLQKMLPHEDSISHALDTVHREQYMRTAHRRFPWFQRGSLLCYAQSESIRYVENRIDRALEVADAIALDGFGYRNHYACFCDLCVSIHGGEEPARIAEYSRESLVETSKHIYEYIVAHHKGAIVMNHVWPPFNPDPYYGADLHLDFCSQTISWFYRPHWSIERVEHEAYAHKRLVNPERNRFVPFIGLYSDPYQTRSTERVAAELEIARRYGEGSVVFCTLQGPAENEKIKRILADALATWREGNPPK